MKIIPKKQKGGFFSSFFSTYTPVNPPSFGRSSGASAGTSSGGGGGGSDSESGRISEKDLFTMLKDIDGLPNEIDSIVKKISYLYNTTTSSRSLATMYASVIGEVKKAKFNKSEFDNAYNLVKEKEGLNEFAITESGQLLAYNRDSELVTVDIKEYMQNKSDYQPITNSNLLWLRSHDPQFRSNNKILEIVSNGIGITQVAKYIKDALPTLEENVRSQEGLTAKQGDKIAKGLAVLDKASDYITEQGMTVDGLYKTKIITKEQHQQAQAALNYIYSMLPENAKAVLQLHSGNSKNPEKGALQVISQLITASTGSTIETSAEFLPDLNIDGSKKLSEKDLLDIEKAKVDLLKAQKELASGSSDLEKDKLSVAEQWYRGYGYGEMFRINDGTNFAFDVYSTTMPIVEKDGTPIEAGSSFAKLQSTQYGGLLQLNKATMGGAKIGEHARDQVILANNEIRSIDYPTDASGNPDFSEKTISQYKQFQAKVKNAGINLSDPNSVKQNAGKINAILRECNLNAAYDAEGNLVQGNWKRFGVVEVVAPDNALSGDVNLKILKEITDQKTIDSWKKKIEKSMDGKLDFDDNNWWSWLEGNYNRMLQGTVWMPLNENSFNAAAGSGKDISRGNALQQHAQQTLTDYSKQQLMMQYNPPSESI